MRGSGLEGMQLTSTVTGDTGDDPAYTLPERLVDLVGVWNGVNWDHSLGHDHPADLGIVIAHTGEDGRQYLPGLIGSDELAQQGRKGGMKFVERGLGLSTDAVEAIWQESPEYFTGCCEGLVVSG